jgi:hypothetical protein
MTGGGRITGGVVFAKTTPPKIFSITKTTK